MSKKLTELNYEREYTPSLHVKRFQEYEQPQMKVIENFIKIGQLATTDALTKYKVKQNVRYGGVNDNQLLDIFYKHQEFGKSIFIYIHGGFWTDLDKSSSGVCVASLLNQDYQVILVDYNLCPHVTLDQLCKEMENFYRWLKIYALKTKANKIIVCGHSAGAHLACQIFQMHNSFFEEPSFKIDQFFLISGIYDLREIWPLRCCNNNNVLNLNASNATKLSPICWLYSKDIITWFKQHHIQINILVSEFDSGTFQKQSQMYAELLKSLDLNIDYQLLQNYDHFNIIEDMINSESPINLYIRNKMNKIY